METIVLISCSSTKASGKLEARDLYTSDLFKKSLAYAESLRPKRIFILSAKYYLLKLDRKIANYDLSLNDFKTAALMKWATRTIKQLRKESDLRTDLFVILAGVKYRKFIEPHLTNKEVPMRGYQIGKQKRWLKENTAVRTT